MDKFHKSCKHTYYLRMSDPLSLHKMWIYSSCIFPKTKPQPHITMDRTARWRSICHRRWIQRL